MKDFNVKQKPLSSMVSMGGGAFSLFNKSGGALPYWSLQLRPNSYDANTSGSCNGPRVDSDGNVYISFIMDDNSGNNERLAGIVKTDVDGVVQWVKGYSNTSTTVNSCSLDVTSNGTILHAYKTSTNKHIEHQLLSTDGATQTWTRRLGNGPSSGSRIQGNIACRIAPNGNYLISGMDNDQIDSNASSFIMFKLNSSSGAIDDDNGLYSNSSGSSPEAGRQFGVDSSSNSYFVMKYYDIPQAPNYAIASTIVKYNSSGAEQWKKEFTINPSGLTQWDVLQFNGCDVTSGGDVYAYGKIVRDNNFVGAMGLIIKTNSSGTVQWAKKIPKENNYGGEIDYSGCVDSSGNFYWIESNRYNGVSSRPSIVVHKVNSSGVVQWARELYHNTHTTSGLSWGFISVDSNDNLYIQCYGKVTSSSDPLGLYVIKVPSDGTETGDYGPLTWATKTPRAIEGLANNSNGYATGNSSLSSTSNPSASEGSFTINITNFSSPTVNNVNNKS
tara:strand:+ start:667 stop:2163 length:1497 start_codon:yes stop_codon:yes gene_type:complete